MFWEIGNNLNSQIKNKEIKMCSQAHDIKLLVSEKNVEDISIKYLVN